MANKNTQAPKGDETKNENLTPEQIANKQAEELAEQQAKDEAKAKKDTEKKNKNTVEVDATFLQNLMEQVKQVPDLISKVQELGDMVRTTADASRLEKFDASRKKSILPQVKIRFYDKQPVVAWRMLQDEVYYDNSKGVWHEKQVRELTLLDGTKVEMSYLDSEKKVDKVIAEVITRNRDFENNEIMVVQFADGSRLTIDSRFIN